MIWEKEITLLPRLEKVTSQQKDEIFLFFYLSRFEVHILRCPYVSHPLHLEIGTSMDLTDRKPVLNLKIFRIRTRRWSEILYIFQIRARLSAPPIRFSLSLFQSAF